MKAHILVVADGHSPTTQHWIKNIQALNYRVSLLSTFPCERLTGLEYFAIIPVAFSRFSSGKPTTVKRDSKPGLVSLVRRFSPLLQRVRYALGPLTIPRLTDDYQRIVSEIQPDLVHALRIPFEGMLASATPEIYPLIVSTWGNDLTLHARGSSHMARWTRRCLQRANALCSDTQRDIRLAKEWGLSPEAPALVVPGSGGLDLDSILNAGLFQAEEYSIPRSETWIINPRGLRPGSVHQHAFFAAIPEILANHPDAVVISPDLQGNSTAEGWVKTLGIGERTFLLPKLHQKALWALMKASKVFVSPSSHDGTPNSFLEAIACGCFPVVGDIESLREWIQQGDNGFLVDPRDPHELAQAVLRALDNPHLRQAAAEKNLAIVRDRASRKVTLPKINRLYAKLTTS